MGPVSGQEGPPGGGVGKHLVHRDTQVQVLSNKLKKKSGYASKCRGVCKRWLYSGGYVLRVVGEGDMGH